MQSQWALKPVAYAEWWKKFKDDTPWVQAPAFCLGSLLAQTPKAESPAGWELTRNGTRHKHLSILVLTYTHLLNTGNFRNDEKWKQIHPSVPFFTFPSQLLWRCPVDGWMDGRMDGSMEGWTDRWKDGQMDGWIDGRTDGWLGDFDSCSCPHFPHCPSLPISPLAGHQVPQCWASFHVPVTFQGHFCLPDFNEEVPSSLNGLISS